MTEKSISACELLAMSLGDRFCVSRKGGTGRGGWEHKKGTDSVDVSGLRFRKALVGSLCGPFFSIYAQCQCLVGAPILAFKAFTVWTGS